MRKHLEHGVRVASYARALACALCLVASAAHAALPIEHWTSASGARVYFVQSRGLPMLDVQIDFDAGGRRASKERAGIAGLTHTLVKAGGATLSEEQISQRYADVGAELGGRVDRDRAGFTLRALSSARELEQALATFAEMLQGAQFPEAAFAREKARLVAALGEEATRPDVLVERAFYRQLYGAHPYAFLPTPAAVNSIARDEVAAFYRDHYVAERAVLTLVGDADRELARSIAERLTARLPRAHSPPAPLPTVAQAAATTVRIAHPATQSHIRVGLPALARGDPDYHSLLVGNYVLGGGSFVSRLYQEVREKRGYAYSVYSYFLPLAQEGPFEIGLQTKRDQSGEALARVRAVLEDFLARGPSAAELAAAKQNLIGGFALRLDSNRKLLEQIASIGFYRLPLTWLDDFAAGISRVRAEDVRAAFARHVRADRLATIVVGGED